MCGMENILIGWRSDGYENRKMSINKNFIQFIQLHIYFLSLDFDWKGINDNLRIDVNYKLTLIIALPSLSSYYRQTTDSLALIFHAVNDDDEKFALCVSSWERKEKNEKNMMLRWEWGGVKEGWMKIYRNEH